MSIKIIRYSLDIVEIDGEESLAIRGVIDPSSLADILVPDYQREVLSSRKTAALEDALKTSRVPDVDLGMRGDRTLARTTDGEEAIYLQDPVYVIDGLQRITAGKQLVEREEARPHIGALIHLETNEKWERDRFQLLNIGQTNLSSNVILRNLAEDVKAARIMLALATDDPKFVMRGKVTWTQNMRTGDLITATSYYKVVGMVHAHVGPGKGSVRQMPYGFEKIIANIGPNVFRANVRAFFELIDETFGVRSVAYREHAVQLKVSFMLALAKVVSSHTNFWTDDRIEVPTYIKRSLAQFPIQDPHVKDLAGSAGKAIDMLAQLIVEHINYGRRTRRLTLRDGLVPSMLDVDPTVDDGE